MSDASAEARGERSVGAAGSIGQVATGDHVVQHTTLLPPQALPPGADPGRVCHLPYRTALFVGRERELARLDEAFGTAHGVVVHAVHGLGGIGKSTLAAHWAARHAAEFNPVWWITAETPADLDAGLAALGRALQPSLAGALPEEALRERTLHWLASHDGWLLVLDNVSDPADITPLLDRAPSGRFLITTRRGATGWRGIAEPLSLDVLEPAEAVELFTKIHQGPADGVEELCDDLGCLPLAVDQAAAYCREARISPRTYRELLARYPADMYAATAEGGEAQRTVGRVWRVTLDRLNDTPMALIVLFTIAWWAPDGIPRRYLEPFHVPNLGPMSSPLAVTEALRRLAAHSLITLHGDTLSVHRLVQAVARTPDPDDPYRDAEMIDSCRDAAVGLLLLQAPKEARLTQDLRDLTTHIEAFAGHTDPATDTQSSLLLFLDAAAYLQSNHFTDRAAVLLQRAKPAAERIWGRGHGDTLNVAGLLSRCVEDQGDRARALALLEQALAESLEHNGPADPATFRMRRWLVQCLTRGGCAQAEAAAREYLAEATRLLGPEHPEAFEARLHLHWVDQPWPKSPQTEVYLADARRLLGEDHASARRLEEDSVVAALVAGETEEALARAERLMARCLRVLGDQHGDTYKARLLRAGLAALTGDPALARELVLGAGQPFKMELGLPPTEHCRRLILALATALTPQEA
ncbi:AAA family ATPase [Streptomyces olindensis]|uniref:AAA family ATPase n=1 Tax=Streptomyces olindensis TaxID=358823 RepID=A0ABV2XU44_9ACTN